MNLLEIMLTSVRAKLSPLVTKFKMWLTPSFIKNKVLVKMRSFFLNLFNLKPRDENDYHAIGKWLVSRRLSYALVVGVAVLCASYIWITRPVSGSSQLPYKAYQYNALPLKFISDKVCILGKSGYTAYIGDVDQGVVAGKGTLYDPRGNMVYHGDFEGNAYNGQGTLYYPDGQVKYEGGFVDNLYEGEGSLNRQDGSLLYEGEFLKGERNGAGKLYGNSGEVVYTGNFKKDWISYQDMLGKTTGEMAEIYTGKRDIYQSDSSYCVAMKDIDAVYRGEDGSNSLDEEWKVSGVYVLNQQILLNGKLADTIPDVEAILGEPVYEGNTALSMTDEVALNLMAGKNPDGALFGKAAITLSDVYDDVFFVEDYDREYLAYLYIYESEGLVYTFFCRDKEDIFSFYMIES